MHECVIVLLCFFIFLSFELLGEATLIALYVTDLHVSSSMARLKRLRLMMDILGFGVWKHSMIPIFKVRFSVMKIARAQELELFVIICYGEVCYPKQS